MGNMEQKRFLNRPASSELSDQFITKMTVYSPGAKFFSKRVRTGRAACWHRLTPNANKLRKLSINYRYVLTTI